jgi:hypothetical protein
LGYSRTKKYSRQKKVRRYFIYLYVHLLALFMIVYLIGSVSTPTSALLNDTEEYLYRVQTAAEFPLDEELLQLLEEMMKKEEEELAPDAPDGEEEEKSEEELNEDTAIEDENGEDQGNPAQENEEQAVTDEEEGTVPSDSSDVDAQPSEEEDEMGQESDSTPQPEMTPEDDPVDNTNGQLSTREGNTTGAKEHPGEGEPSREQPRDQQQSGDQQ